MKSDAVTDWGWISRRLLGALLGAALGQTFTYYRGQRERYEELLNTLARINNLDDFGTYRETLPILKMEIRHNYRENISNLEQSWKKSLKV